MAMAIPPAAPAVTTGVEKVAAGRSLRTAPAPG